MHIRPIRCETCASGSNHLRAERARGRAGKAAVPRVMDSYAMNNRGLAVVAVRGSSGINNSLNNASQGTPRRRHMWVGALKLVEGRFSGMRNAPRFKDGGS